MSLKNNRDEAEHAKPVFITTDMASKWEIIFKECGSKI